MLRKHKEGYAEQANNIKLNTAEIHVNMRGQHDGEDHPVSEIPLESAASAGETMIYIPCPFLQAV